MRAPASCQTADEQYGAMPGGSDRAHSKVRAMGYVDTPAGERVLHKFAIHRDPLGHWVASETHGLSEGVFFNFKEAFRFAMREADGDADRVHIEPAPAFSEY